MMDAEEKLKRIAAIYETRTPMESSLGGQHRLYSSTHARFNLMGALLDMERTGIADDICLESIRKVVTQLAEIEKILFDGKKKGDPT